jgi:GNAT superfamily N-acetyltransferase
MSKVVIQKFSPLLGLSEMRSIFFESSQKKDFKDESERETFYFKYLGFYLDKYPEYALVAVDQDVIGYCLGTLDSKDKELLKIQPHLSVFEDLFSQYPAHLHINCHASYRGSGLGSKLLLAFERELTGKNISGLHIMTSSDAKNKSFYLRAGYDHLVEREWQGKKILFMGKRLSHQA